MKCLLRKCNTLFCYNQNTTIYVIHMNRGKSIEEYAMENKSLKNTVDILSRQVAYWKKVIIW